MSTSYYPVDAADEPTDMGQVSYQPIPPATITGGGTLQGGPGGDTLRATAYGTQLDGGAGDDTMTAALDGSVFDLVFTGGAGDDTMYGSYARDTYVYRLGDGHDVIYDDVRWMGAGVVDYFRTHPDADTYQDKLVFGAGIATTDVTGERVGGDLVLHVRGDEGSIRVGGWFDGTIYNKIESFVFDDGTTWLASDIDHRLGEASPGVVASGGGTLTGSQYDDNFTATAYGTQLLGNAGNDTLSAAADGGVFGVQFAGGAGDDHMVGSYAGDTYRYELGDGHDVIRDDVRRMGDGVADYFYAHSGTASYQDTLVFGAGITAADVQAEHAGEDLVLHVRGDQGSVRIEGWFDGTIFDKIETVRFADGTAWSAVDIDHRLGELSPGVMLSGSGLLTGSQYDDGLQATAGGTWMEGGAGNDTLTAVADGGVFGLSFSGGAGNDFLVGTYAGDTYRYELGDGADRILDDVRALGQGIADYFQANSGTASYQDQIVFGEGISASDIQAARVADDLVLHVGSQGSIDVAGWYDGTMFNKIERLVFADGTTWLASDIDHRLGQASPGVVTSGGGTLTGSQYDDSFTASTYGTQLQGGAGNDQLSAAVDGGVFAVSFTGGAGNDVLTGSYAGDTFHYNRGDGYDVIQDDVRALGQGVADYFHAQPNTESYQDTLAFGEGIYRWDVRPERSGDDLLLWVADPAQEGEETGSVRVAGWFDGTFFDKIEHITFADGFEWLASDLDTMLGEWSNGIVASGSGTVTGSQYNDSLSGSADGARLEGGAGNDVLTASSGAATTFVGGWGNDALNGSTGNDVYAFAPNDGNDRVADQGGEDLLRFGVLAAPDAVLRTRVGNDLVFDLHGSGTVTVADWFDGTGNHKIELIGFADGAMFTSQWAENGL